MKPGSEGAPAGVILITADKGLAGAFNSNVIAAAEGFARRQERACVTIRSGLKARNAVRRMGMPDHRTWLLGAPSKIETAREVARAAYRRFRSAAQFREIVLVSQKLVSMMSQRPETRKLVPILTEDLAALRGDGDRRGKSAVHARSDRVCAVARIRALAPPARNISSSRSIPQCSKPTPHSSPRSS